MADIKFSCPHCNQHITCDELWGGHQLQCPGCQGGIIVPAVAAAAPEPTANSLVPKVPTGPGRLSKSPAPSAAAAGGSAPARNIPIRNLAPAVKKKQSPVVKFAIAAAVLVVLGAGGYFGYIWLSDMQSKANAKSREAEKNSDGGQVGHIAELNAVMDATEPGKAPAEGGARRRQRQNPGGQQVPLPADGAVGASAPATPTDTQPVVPAVWTLNLATAKIPDGRVNGSISGSNFVAEAVRIDPVGSAQVLRLIQGQVVSPDREVLVYLHLKPGEKLGGQTLAISQDMIGVGVPQVTKRWKTDPRFAARLKSFSTGYAMKLELGALTNNLVPGKIFLALPDTEQTVVAGTFNASVLVVDPNAMQAMPVASPTTPMPNSTRAAFDQRYGIRR
jgi:hypothetical protein